MAENDLDRKIDTLAQWLHESQNPVIFTGAGISTDSGLPDFRGPDGVWTRRDKGLPPIKMDKPWDSVDPNIAHLAVLDLQNMGKLKFLISQNIDNLHLKSGIEFERLAELHGNIARLRCESCEKTTEKIADKTACTCGGNLISSVIGFGMALPQEDIMQSYEHSRNCDLFVVIGSSLVVTPAADMPVEALRAGAKLVIINRGETPLDEHCHLRFEEDIGEVFPEAVERLKAMMGS
ncbi:MAG: Sir2 family NAD-dependent protein deacetylase [Desulfobacterales bacterium]